MSDIDSLYLLAALAMGAITLFMAVVRLCGPEVAAVLLVLFALFLPIPNHRGAWAEAFGVALIVYLLTIPAQLRATNGAENTTKVE